MIKQPVPHVGQAVCWSFAATSGRGILGRFDLHLRRPDATTVFPITALIDEPACYAELVKWLNPDGLAYPCCHQHDRMVVRRRGRDPVLAFRCGHRHRVFSVFTDTALHGTKPRPRDLILVIRGFAQGVRIARLACELGRDRPELLNPRRRLQDLAFGRRDVMPLQDEVLEADARNVTAPADSRHSSPAGCIRMDD